MNELTRIAAADVDPAHALTARNFQHFMEVGAFEDMRAELVDGAIEKMMPAKYAHGESHAAAIGQLYTAYSGSGFRITTDLAVRIDDENVRAPDIAVLSEPHEGSGLPDARTVFLAVEISDSTLGRDLGRKRLDYSRASIAHYWIVDVSGRTVRVMSDPSEGGYTSEVVARFGEPIPVPGTDRTITID